MPTYGCAASLRELCTRLTAALTPLAIRFEIVLVDDGGPGQEWSVITTLVSEDERIRGVKLSRNFGQHAALAAGIRQATGQWIATMDGDLQDPPETLPDLYAVAVAGADVVFGRRRTQSKGWVRRGLTRLYFAVLNAITDEAFDPREGTLTLFSRQVATSYLELAERDRHHVMALRWLGFRRGAVDYDQQPRRHGRSGYTLWSLIDHMVSAFFFSSVRLLKLIVSIGVISALGGFLMAAILVYRRFMFGYAPGWTGLVVVELVVSGGIVICIGTVGMYVGRVFDQVRRRPVFVVEQTVGDAPRNRELGSSRHDETTASNR